MSEIRLYHAGFSVIEVPDVKHGRANADFGQGFYLSGDPEFSARWAKARKGEHTFINEYVLSTDGLNILRFERDEDWFKYIFRNRSGGGDAHPEYDVVVGPIANDTLYDTWGVITSGLLKPAQALPLLTFGPLYSQTVIKTAKAVSRLHFVGAREVSPEELQNNAALVKKEEALFQAEFARRLEAVADLLG